MASRGFLGFLGNFLRLAGEFLWLAGGFFFNSWRGKGVEDKEGLCEKCFIFCSFQIAEMLSIPVSEVAVRQGFAQYLSLPALRSRSRLELPVFRAAPEPGRPEPRVEAALFKAAPSSAGSYRKAIKKSLILEISMKSVPFIKKNMIFKNIFQSSKCKCIIVLSRRWSRPKKRRLRNTDLLHFIKK